MRRLLTPRWIAAHVAVLAVVLVSVNLGFWQLRRLEERRLDNAVGTARFESEPVDFAFLATEEGAGEDLDSLENLRVTVTGRFLPEHEVLIRSQVYRGTAGFHVITPLLIGDDRAVLVNRGWVPLVLDRVPVEEASPPSGEVTIEGWLRPTQTRQALAPADPDEGRLVAMNRVDIERIGEQVPLTLAPVYIVELRPDTGDLPIPVDPPGFDEEGPHLGYAVQWFGFALIGLGGYAFLLRRAARRSG